MKKKKRKVFLKLGPRKLPSRYSEQEVFFRIIFWRVKGKKKNRPKNLNSHKRNKHQLLSKLPIKKKIQRRATKNFHLNLNFKRIKIKAIANCQNYFQEKITKRVLLRHQLSHKNKYFQLKKQTQKIKSW